MKQRSHDEFMVGNLHADPIYAAELLADVRRDGHPAELAILLPHMAEAFGHDMLGIVSLTGKKLK